MNTDPNAHVSEFLEYYLKPENELDYAVLISGRWGSGKTHTVKAYLEKSEAKHFYISLNGVTAVRQIEEEFYRQLHPFLSSKGMRIAGAVVRGAIKTTLKIDLDGDGKDDGSVTAQLPQIDLIKELGDPKSHILVFDDIERSAMPIPSVLGYINGFVEHDGLKAVLLGNEDEIDRIVGSKGDDDKESAYKRIKEKLIGQTLRVSANAPAAFERFVSGIADKRTREFCKNQKDLIVALHAESETDNLRLLKHALFDFARLSSSFEDRHWSVDRFTVEILKVCIALSFEIRSGRIEEADLADILTQDYARFFRQRESGELSIDQKVRARYPNADFERCSLSPETIRRLLFDGWADAFAIKQDVDQSSSFAEPNSIPIWRRGWNTFELPDDEFAEVVADIEREFASRAIIEPGEMLHVFGTRLRFASIGAIKFTINQIVTGCKTYIDDLSRSGRLKNLIEAPFDDFSYENHGYPERDTPAFKKIAKHLYEVAEKTTQAAYPDMANELLAKLDDDADDFFLDLTFNNVRSARYARRPVLAALDPADFVNKVVASRPASQTKAFQALSARYESNALKGDLSAELPWLRKVATLFGEAAKVAAPNTRGRLTALVKSALRPAIAAASPPKKPRTKPTKPTPPPNHASAGSKTRRSSAKKAAKQKP